MYKIFIAALAVSICACNTAAEKETPKEEVKEVAVPSSAITNNSGYKATYSSSFAMSDGKNAETILALYKFWDGGSLDGSKPLFADSVSFYTSDGTAILGKKDTAIANMQAYRNMFSAISNTVHAVFPVKTTDANEDWVCIWATEVYTHKNGKKDSIQLQETWRFNKEGKIDLLYQYARSPLPPGK